MDIHVDSLEFSQLRIIDGNGQVTELDLEKELRVNEYSMQEEFLNQAPKYIYWASILEKVRMYQESASLALEVVGAQMNEKARDYYKTVDTKPTKDQVEAYILQQEEYQVAYKQLLTYNHLVKQLQYVVKAFEQRKDMLIQYGADLRKNKDNGISPNFG
ncbi:hypothetical protein [Listeria phage 20422-1]|uniref:recombination protein n=1 Tax=Listeria phage WIL-1 TaxID=1541821 RepID=UPI00248CA6EB|nr:recombination protein [Listeria phage WIL-1]